MSEPLALTLLAFVGLFAGGIVTSVVDRIPDAMKFGRYRCPFCWDRLSFRDTIPVVSWIMLRRRCRHCHATITWAYPAVEIATAVAFVGLALRFDFSATLVPALIWVCALIALSVIDLYVYRLPDRLMFPAIGAVLVAIVFAGLVESQWFAIVHGVAGGLGYFVVMFITHIISPRGMGFGDVKLSLLLGLFVGFVAGLEFDGASATIILVMYSLLIGTVLGIVLGIVVGVAGKLSKRQILPDPLLEEEGEPLPSSVFKQAFPFGPALAMGALIVVLIADSLVVT